MCGHRFSRAVIKRRSWGPFYVRIEVSDVDEQTKPPLFAEESTYLLHWSQCQQQGEKGGI